MKVLLDEDLPHDLRHYLTGHDVSTVRYMGWNGLKNGTLLRTAEEAGFQVFVTGDQSVAAQQNMKGRRFGLVTLTAQRLEVLLLHIEAIQGAIGEATPESSHTVECSE